jgi:hypothetical protein
MAHADALVDEIANELDTWPGVRIERRADGAAVARFERLELGVLYPDRGVAELRFDGSEEEELIEHGDTEPGEFDTVRHDVAGPSDVTAVLALFDRRYRELRGDDEPYSSADPG